MHTWGMTQDPRQGPGFKFVGCNPKNFKPGRATNTLTGKPFRPFAIVIHVMEGSLYGTDAFFAQERAKPSSAHYGIGRSWENRSDPNAECSIHQYVKEEHAAYHAGIEAHPKVPPTWKLYRPGSNPNDYTIGIEHEGFALTTWTPQLYRASSRLIEDIAHRWNIPLDRDHIVGHREIDPVRKGNCPGRCDFDHLIQLAADIREEREATSI